MCLACFRPKREKEETPFSGELVVAQQDRSLQGPKRRPSAVAALPDLNKLSQAIGLSKDPSVRPTALNQLIGTGPLGPVYSGIWRRQPVAVKCVGHTEAAGASFQAVGCLLQSIDHPNVVKLLHIETHAGEVLARRMDLKKVAESGALLTAYASTTPSLTGFASEGASGLASLPAPSTPTAGSGFARFSQSLARVSTGLARVSKGSLVRNSKGSLARTSNPLSRFSNRFSNFAANKEGSAQCGGTANVSGPFEGPGAGAGGFSLPPGGSVASVSGTVMTSSTALPVLVPEMWTCLIMEHLTSGSLADLLEPAEAPMQPVPKAALLRHMANILNIAHGIASALNHLHTDLGICHGAVKPANVLLLVGEDAVAATFASPAQAGAAGVAAISAQRADELNNHGALDDGVKGGDECSAAATEAAAAAAGTADGRPGLKASQMVCRGAESAATASAVTGTAMHQRSSGHVAGGAASWASSSTQSNYLSHDAVAVAEPPSRTSTYTTFTTANNSGGGSIGMRFAADSSMGYDNMQFGSSVQSSSNNDLFSGATAADMGGAGGIGGGSSRASFVRPGSLGKSAGSYLGKSATGIPTARAVPNLPTPCEQQALVFNVDPALSTDTALGSWNSGGHKVKRGVQQSALRAALNNPAVVGSQCASSHAGSNSGNGTAAAAARRRSSSTNTAHGQKQGQQDAAASGATSTDAGASDAGVSGSDLGADTTGGAGSGNSITRRVGSFSAAVVPVVAKLGDCGLSHVHLSVCSNGRGPWNEVDGPTRGKTAVDHVAPELLLTGALHHSTDVYSFGVLLWELVTGHMPYPHMRTAEVVYKVAVGGVRPAFSPAVPLEYRKLAEACWVSDPGARPSFAEILASLERMQADVDRLQEEWERRQAEFGALMIVPYQVVAPGAMPGMYAATVSAWAKVAGVASSGHSSRGRHRNAQQRLAELVRSG